MKTMGSMCELFVLLCVVSACYCASSPQRGTYTAQDQDRFFYFHDYDFDYHHDHNSTPAATRSEEPRNKREIPLDLLRQFREVIDLNEFISNFVDQSSIKNTTQESGINVLSNRFGGGDERKSAEIPKQAGCIPEMKVVSLRNSDDPALFFYPFCTRIERCGGCCGSALLSCQPTQTEMVNYQVVVTEYNGGKQMLFKSKEIIPIERHTKCKCDCILKEKDCNKFQEYRKHECRCLCLNVDEQQKCSAENDTKLWDPSTCTCECRETKECTTGYYFDQNMCRCVQTPRTKNNVNLQMRQRRGQTRSKTSQFGGRTIARESN